MYVCLTYLSLQGSAYLQSHTFATSSLSFAETKYVTFYSRLHIKCNLNIYWFFHLLIYSLVQLCVALFTHLLACVYVNPDFSNCFSWWWYSMSVVFWMAKVGVHPGKYASLLYSSTQLKALKILCHTFAFIKKGYINTARIHCINILNIYYYRLLIIKMFFHWVFFKWLLAGIVIAIQLALYDIVECITERVVLWVFSVSYCVKECSDWERWFVWHFG